MDDLVIITQILNYAQVRTEHCALVHVGVRRGLLPEEARGFELEIWNDLLSDLYIISLVDEAIIYASTLLGNQDIQQMLFQKDIKIQEDAPTSPKERTPGLVNSFEHVDLIRQVVFTMSHNLDDPFSDAWNGAGNYILANFVDNYLAKNDEIIQTLIALVNNQKDTLKNTINFFTILPSSLLVGAVLLFSTIIWKQYKKEKSYILALLQLNPRMIQHTLENLNQFHKRILNQETCETELQPHLIYPLENPTYDQEFCAKVMREKNLKKRYKSCIVKVFGYIFFLLVIIIINSRNITKATNEIYRQQRQIQYSNEISNALSISYLAQIETLLSNNTNHILRQLPLDIWNQEMEHLKEIQTNMVSEFLLEDGTYDPDVQEILFSSAYCSRFPGPYDVYCQPFVFTNHPTSMISALSSFQSASEDAREAFYNANKSSTKNFFNLKSSILSCRVSIMSVQLIHRVLSPQLEYNVSDLENLGIKNSAIFSLALMVVGVLMWFQVFTKFRNNLKKILTVLPPNVILSNFLLKTLLNKTSKI